MIYVKGSYTDSKTLKVGESIKIEMEGAKYYTNNNEVLEVSNNGLVAARFLGDATVFAKDGYGKMSSATTLNNLDNITGVALLCNDVANDTQNNAGLFFS